MYPRRKSFFSNIQGNVAPVFGLLTIPVLTVVGGAIDFSATMSTKAKLQNALDAAAVAVCSGGNGEQSSEDILRAFLKAELDGSKLSVVPKAAEGEEQQGVSFNDVELENPDINAADGSVSPTLRVKVPTRILPLIGLNEIDVSVTSEVVCGAKRLELSLVLDVTGSMNSSVGGRRKIDSMKDAGLDVLDIFKRNLEAGVTRIALVPFAGAVNAGNYADKVRGTIKSGTSQQVGFQKLKFRDKNYDWRWWHDTKCVSERLGSDAYKDTAPNCSGSSCSAPVGHVYTSNGSCKPGNVILPLTNDSDTLRQNILSYQPDGYTAGHIGAAWGWYMLSDKWSSVFPAASQPEVPDPEELIKATIIMTDGEFNTDYYNGVQDRYTRYSSNNGSSKSQFAKVCEAMKDPNGDGVYDEDESVVVYTIGFGLNPSGSTAQRLKDCATDDTKYFFPYNGEELRAAFVSIGKQLSGGQVGKAIVRQ
jgi:Putative Flp pilus-assembly TadE/G-like